MADKPDTQAAQITINDAAAKKLGTDLSEKFSRFEKDRILAELKWARNARQYLGIYDPDVLAKMDPSKSLAYPKLTRVKCVSMLSRLMNLLFPTDDKNWSVGASPVPELSAVDLQKILTVLDAEVRAADPNAAPTNEMIESAIRKLADKRATRLELEIKDQLQELGGNRAFDYTALARKVLASGIQFGHGVLKGPFVQKQKQRRWIRNMASGALEVKDDMVERPRFEFVPIWNYYPDMTAKTFEQMEGQFQREVLSRHQLLALKNRSDFMKAQIDKAIAAKPTGNYKCRTFETEIKAMGVHLNVDESVSNKYEAIVWEGYVPGKDLVACGVTLTEAQKLDDVKAIVWMIDQIPIKVELAPWTVLMGEDAPLTYHHFIFEEDESTIIGNALPNIMRDSQMSVCAGARMVLDNGSIACGLNLEVNLALLMPGQDTSSIQTNKIWYRDDENIQTMALPAVKAIDIPSRIGELKTIVDMFSNFADQETFVNPATGGDMSKMPSEPFRSAAGASMMKGDAALPFKDVVRNFDMFTQSVIGAIIAFNKKFNKNPDVQGDFQPVARGATSLIAKEVLGMQLDNIAATLTEEEKLYVNMHKLARMRFRVRDLESADLVVDDEEAAKREQAQSEKQGAAEAVQNKMIEAQIREILSSTLKNLSQAGKNSAAAEATTANVILNALEKGVSPDAIANTATGSATAGQDPATQNGNGGVGGPAVPAAAPGEMPGEVLDSAPGAAAVSPGGSAAAGFPPIPDAERAVAIG